MVALGLFAQNMMGQGLLHFTNPRAPTYIWSIDGPLAGPEIYAQLLAGPQTDSLAPVGFSFPHGTGALRGYVNGPSVVVPGIDCSETAYVKMIVWDSTLWGTSLVNVPAAQLGMTDTIRVAILCDSSGPISTPLFFTQSAIVPVPEPSVIAFGIFGAAVLVFFRRIR